MRWSLAALFSLAIAASVSAGAIHHYSFDDGASVVDSVGADDGTLVNGASLAGGQLALDGVNDYVDFSQYLVPSSGPFSVTFFAQQTVAPANYAEIISQGFSGGPGFYIGHDPSHNIRIGDTWMGTAVPFPSDGLMHHYAVVSDATDVTLYIDGAFVANKGLPLTMTSGGDTTRLGNQYNPYVEYFEGSIDELWIFDNALTPGEVSSLATVPEPASFALAAMGSTALGLLALRRYRQA